MLSDLLLRLRGSLAHLYWSGAFTTKHVSAITLTFSTAAYHNSPLLDVDADERVPHIVKYLMHVRLQLECPDVEKLDSAARPVRPYSIQLLPGFW